MPTGMNETFSAGEIRQESSGFNSLLGPISRGLFMASGLFEAANLFGASSQYTKNYRQLKVQAAQALEQGFQTGMDVAREGKQITGEMTAAFGKSGSLLEGSPLLTLVDTTRNIERDVSRAIEQGRIQQQALLYQARQMKKAAKGSKLGGILKIAGVAAAPFTGGASLGISSKAWGS